MIARTERLPEQHRAARPDVSAWVSANAGSGKTSVLVDRIVRLLLAGAEPSRLLCLTFTKSAAAEMAERLHALLGSWALATDTVLSEELRGLEGAAPDKATMARARELFARVLETPGGLKIQTIHAFCEGLLARFPLEAQLHPHFRVIEDRTADELASAIRDGLLEDAARNMDAPLARAIARITELSNDQGLDDVLRALRDKRKAWLAVGEGGGDIAERVAAMRDLLRLGKDESEGSLLQSIASFVDRFELKRVARALMAGSVKAEKLGQALADALELRDPKRIFDALHEMAINNKGVQRDTPFDKGARKFDADAEELAQQAADGFIVLQNKLNAAFIAEATQHVYVIAEAFFLAYETGKRRKGLLDYDDLIERADRLLNQSGAAAWVLYKLDGGIDHILIDEAQDTSPGQWRIVNAIADEFFAGLGREPKAAAHRPRTIFAVGDLKQSIFSFQGADPDAFIAMRNRLREMTEGAQTAFESIPLTRSYRSTQPPMRLVDAVFASEDARDGVANGQDRIHHQVTRLRDAGLVEVWEPVHPTDRDDVEDVWDAPFDTISDTHPKIRLGQKIARQISDWMKSGEILASKGRPVLPDDILILVRKRDALADEIIRQLKMLGVPVSGADRLVLMDHIAAQDLFALGNFALNPNDDLNLGGLLKSPLLGLSEEELFELAHDRGERSLWAALQDRADYPATSGAHRRLRHILAQADRMPPFEFYARALGPDGGRMRLLARLGEDANDPIDEFLNLALAYERDHPPSLQGFLDWLTRGSTQIKRDLDRGGGVVRVMTVHGAKGLEAEIVILPDTCQTPSKSRRPMFLDAGNGVLVWSVQAARDDALRAKLLESERRKEMQEYRRLLYVALTRARDRLYICGYESRNGKKDEGCWYDLIAPAMRSLGALESIDADGAQILRIESAQENATARPAIAMTAPAPELPPWLKVSAAPEESRSRIAPSKARSPQREGSKAAMAFGAAVHDILMRLGSMARAPELSQIESWAAAMLDAEHAPVAALEAFRIRTGEDFTGLFTREARGEVPFSIIGSDGARIVGRFDRIVLSPGAALVVEFKTTRQWPEAVAEIGDSVKKQLRLYAHAARVLFPGRAISMELIWTAAPMRMIVPSHFGEDELARLDQGQGQP